jgi:hypothetical protein
MQDRELQVEHRRIAFRDYMAVLSDNEETLLRNMKPIADFYEYLACVAEFNGLVSPKSTTDQNASKIKNTDHG